MKIKSLLVVVVLMSACATEKNNRPLILPTGSKVSITTETNDMIHTETSVEEGSIRTIANRITKYAVKELADRKFIIDSDKSTTNEDYHLTIDMDAIEFPNKRAWISWKDGGIWTHSKDPICLKVTLTLNSPDGKTLFTANGKAKEQSLSDSTEKLGTWAGRIITEARVKPTSN